MSKNVKDLFDGLQNAEDLAASKIQVVGKDTTNGIVEDGVDTVIVDGSVSKIGVYGNGTDDITVKGYAGKGTAKSVAGIELSDKAGEVAGATVVLEDGITAKLVAGSKVEFTAEDKKYAPTSVEPKTVVIADSDVVIYDAKVTDAFAGAVMTDTATSKKYKVEVQAITKDACIDVIGGTVTNVYAGGAGATSITENATINISGGKVTNVYAGGTDGAKVIGDVNINVDMNAAAAAAAMSIGTIYAGGKNANVLGDVTITVTTNGAVGSNGKIGKIVGAPSGKGVVFGSKNLVLDAYQGDFAASVKGMDTVTIKDNSAVTFTKGQDKSMVNAEYIIELSEIDNSNQAAILTLKSDYKLNKLTVSIDSDLITEGGSFSRALVQGVKGKFNSSKFDVNQVNIKKDEGGLIADYQYELSFETVESKGKQVETGKLIFTYTGATLELSVDGYINRQGVANVLSSADDVVSFGWSYDPINKNYDREIAYNFKTMAGDDVVTIDDNTYFTGKLSLGAGNDTLTINGRLAKLDLSGAGENTVVINGALDARNITTSDDSVNTFIVNGQFAATEVSYTGTVNALNKVVFLYSDGSTTVDSVNSKKKIVSVTQAVYDAASGQWIETVTPWQANFTVDQFLTGADQNVAAAAAQDLTLTKGDNTVVVNNAAGINDITLGGGQATVVIADAYAKEIDLRSASESTLIIDEAGYAGTFTGSRRGTSNVVIAADGVISSIAALDLKYKDVTLELKDAVTFTVTGGWTQAGLAISDVKFGDNSMLVDQDASKSYVYNYSGYWTNTGFEAFGTISDSVIIASGAATINNLENSSLTMTGAAATINGAVNGSEIITDNAVNFNGAVDATSLVAVANATFTFAADANIDSFVYGANNVTVNVYNASVNVADITDREYVAGLGYADGSISIVLDEADFTTAVLKNASAALTNSTLNVVDFAGSINNATASVINVEGVVDAISINLVDSTLNIAQDGTVGTLAIDATSAIAGAGVLTVTNALNIAADFTFGDDSHKVVIGEDATVTATAGTVKGDVAKITINGATITESNIAELTVVAGTIGDAVVAEKSAITAATIADKAVVDLGVVSGAANLTAEGEAAITADFENGLTLNNGKFAISSNDDNGVVDVKGGVVVNNAELAADVRVWNYNGPVANGITAIGNVKLDGKFEADVTAADNATVVLAEGTEIFRDNDDEYSTDAYGKLNFINGTLVVEGDSIVEKGVNATGDLTVLGGTIDADFDVAGTLTLGKSEAEEDYVIWGDKDTAAINAAIKGNVKADTLLNVAAQAVEAIISEGAITAGAINVGEGSKLTAEDATVTGAVTVKADAPTINGAKEYDSAAAAFNNLTAGSVALEDTVIEGKAGAKLDVAADLNATGDIYVGKKAAMTVGVDAAGANLTVMDDATAAVKGDAAMTGAVAVIGKLDVDGALSAAYAVVNGELEAGSAAIAGDFDINGKAAVEGAVSAANVNVNADAELTAADVKASGNVAVAGEANVKSIDADGFVSVSGKANVTEAVKTDWLVYVNGELNAASVDAASDVTVDLGGKAVITGAVDAANVGVAGTLEAGDVTATGFVNVTGKAEVAAVNAGWYVNVTGELIADSIYTTDEIIANGAITLAGDITAKSLTVGVDGSVTVANISVDELTVSNALTISGEIKANQLTVNGDKEFTINGIVGGNVIEGITTGENAALTINNANVKLAGDIAMVGTNSNAVAISVAQEIAGKLSYVATTAVEGNTLTIGADVAVTNGVEFSQNLTANLNGKLTADITSVPYGAEGADVNDKLIITGTAAVIDGSIALGEGDDVIDAFTDVTATAIDFGKGSDKLYANLDRVITADITADDLTVAGANVKVYGDFTADKLTLDGSNLTVDGENGVTVNTVALNGKVLSAEYSYLWDDDSNPETPDVLNTVDAAINTDGNGFSMIGNGTIGASVINDNVAITGADNATIIADIAGNVVLTDVAGATINGDVAGDVSFAEKSEGYAGANNLTLNGVVSGAADLTNADKFGGNNEVNGGVTFSELTVAAGSDITANFTADAPELSTSITPGTYANVAYYKWLGAFGPAGLGAFKSEDVVTTAYDNVALTLENDVTIIGNVTGSNAVDTITVGSDDRITGVLDFGTAAVNETTAGMDKLTSAAANTLSVDKVKFNGGLDINNVSLDRNVAMEDVKEQLEDAILAALGDSLTADVTTSAFSVEINGNTYGVAFELIDASLADDDPAKFDKSNIKVTVTGVDTTTVEGAGVLKVSSDITVNGSVKLSDADDVLALNGDLTLNDIVIGDIATNYQYVITDAATGEGYWEAVAGSENAAIVDGAKKEFDFGAGTDAIVMADGVVLTAAKVAFDSLNIVGAEGYTADAAINADLEGKAVLNITRANVTVNGNVSAASTIVDAAYFTVNGDLSSGVVVNADGFKVVGAITGEVILNKAFDSSLTSVINGNVILNQVVEFTEDPAATVAVVTQGALNFGAGSWNVANEAKINGTANAAAVTVVNNSIVAVTGTQEDVYDVDGITVIGQNNVTSLTISGAADIDGADASVNDSGVLLVGSVANLNALTLNGKVNAAVANNIDSLIVNGVNTIAAASGIDAVTVNKDAVLNGTTIAFTEMSVTGEGTVKATLEGTVAQDKLTLNGANVQIVNFAGSADTAVDTLTLEGANTAASVYFSGYGAIEGAGTLTGNVSIAGAGALTIGSAITGNVTGAAGVELIANAAISGTASGFGSYTGTGSVTNIAIDGAANVALQATTGIAGSANDDVLTLSANAGAIDLAAGADTLVIGAAVKAASLAGVETIAFDLSAAVAAGTTLLDLTTELSAADAAAATLDLSALAKEDFAGLAAGDDVVTLFKSAAAVSNDAAIAGWSLTLDGGLTATCEYDTTLKAYTITIA